MARRISYEQQQGALDDAEIYIPPARKPKDLSAEWRLQSKAVKLCRKRMRADAHFRFIAPMAESPRDARRAAVAKLMGLQAGVPDLWLIGSQPFRLVIVEFKRPGGKLTDEQSKWFAWFYNAGVDCHRCDNLNIFRNILDTF